MDFQHRPVMPREALELLGCKPDGTYIDGTLGGGGHALEILKASAPNGRLIGIDRDEDALKAAKALLESFGDRVIFVRENFSEVKRIINGLGIGPVDGMLLDLGVSSHQLETPERGFSFRFDSRLDMRMDNRQGLTAHELVNESEPDELARIFRDYGEEREARKIARAIEKARLKKPIETTGQLAAIIEAAVPRKYHPGAIHPATRAFQALRIAVNDELGSIGKGIEGGFDVLKKGGRMAAISFHSLEDRIVKTMFRDFATGCVCPPRVPVCVCGKEPVARLVTRKPLTPGEDEINENPRARSAKFRAIEKII